MALAARDPGLSRREEALMATKWIQSAIHHPGSLKATAVKLGFLKSHDDELTPGVLGQLMAHAKKTGNSHLERQVNLARTLRKMQ
jgi:hypothetical protein